MVRLAEPGGERHPEQEAEPAPTREKESGRVRNGGKPSLNTKTVNLRTNRIAKQIMMVLYEGGEVGRRNRRERAEQCGCSNGCNCHAVVALDRVLARESDFPSEPQTAINCRST